MLYEVLKRMIGRGQAEGLAQKLDVFFAASRITADEYEELSKLLQEGQR